MVRSITSASFGAHSVNETLWQHQGYSYCYISYDTDIRTVRYRTGQGNGSVTSTVKPHKNQRQVPEVSARCCIDFSVTVNNCNSKLGVCISFY